jgi:uncharacterized protein YigE (DUF2233 family)
MKRLILLFTIIYFFQGCSDVPVPAKKGQNKKTTTVSNRDDEDYLTAIAFPSQIKMYWKTNEGKVIRTLEHLAEQEPTLLFAMNGGMFQKDYSPAGLYIEKGKQLHALKKYNNPNVNFGIQPQGVFWVRQGKAFITAVEKFTTKEVDYATQSAPMLLINGEVNPQLPTGRELKRNGVGILKNGKVLLAVSRGGVNFPEFAKWFQQQGCTTALFLDGSVSEAWRPGFFTFGDFGIMIGVLPERQTANGERR